MPIPKTRPELLTQIETSFQKLCEDLDRLGPQHADRVCVDDWSVRELLAVRAWWTASVVDWVRRGREGEELDLPAPGYGWSETPRLNADIIEEAAGQSYGQLRDRLEDGVARLLSTVADLDDTQLLTVGVFPWAGKWPIARWLSLNTIRQYTTARSYVRKVLREIDG